MYCVRWAVESGGPGCTATAVYTICTTRLSLFVIIRYTITGATDDDDDDYGDDDDYDTSRPR